MADFLTTDSPMPGLERLEARFHGHAYDPHRHETYAIGLTLDGAQGFRYRGAAQVSRAGQIMVLHPDEQHDGHAAVPDGFSYRMIYVDPALILSALEHDGVNALPFVADAVTRDRALAALIKEAFADFPGRLDPLAGDALLAGLADALARRARQDARRPAATPHRALLRVRDFLDAEFARPIDSADLERVADLDRFSLARAFRRSFGTAPHRYLVARRVTAARSLIAEGTPLAEIAGACGFADQSHLNRHFKAHFGMTPGRYARLVAQ
ncbi:AraC family ligand binding domain-containing protein [Dongia sp.]|uniref:AraC family transcriptional regulator n=1 Tax=Dongia sp. TaxID=1977262 RepID=UPI0037523DC3